MYKRILIPLDGSLLAEQAICCIEHLAAADAEVILLQVLRTPTPIVSPEMAVPVSVVDNEAALQAAQAYLDDRAQKLAQEKGVRVYGEAIEEHFIAPAIVDFAEQKNVDLIMMSTHGRGGISRLVFGSVTEDVLRHAPCPVLISRPH